MSAPNLYEVLQVSPQATPDVIRAAYRALARTYHPDVNGSERAARLMRQLNEAFTALSDPALRASYDARRIARARQRNARRTSRPRWGEPAVKRTLPAAWNRARPAHNRPVLGALAVMLVVAALAMFVWLMGELLDESARVGTIGSVVTAEFRSPAVRAP